MARFAVCVLEILLKATVIMKYKSQMRCMTRLRTGEMPLLLIARIKERNSKDFVWNRLESSIDDLKQRGVDPLYISKKSNHMETSLIVSAKSIDAFLDSLIFVLKDISGSEDISIIPLIKPIFFDVPENIGKDAIRYLISITTRPSDSLRVYEIISEFRASSDTALIYLAFACQMHCDTLTLSAFSKSDDHLSRFIQQELKSIPGIVKVSITPIEKSKRLVPYADMVGILRREIGQINVTRPIMDLSDLQ